MPSNRTRTRHKFLLIWRWIEAQGYTARNEFYSETQWLIFDQICFMRSRLLLLQHERNSFDESAACCVNTRAYAYVSNMI